jgi:hypothetical protein
MPQNKRRPAEIVAKLRQVDVLLSPGRAVAEPKASATVSNAARTAPLTTLVHYTGSKVCRGSSLLVSGWNVL